MNRRSGTRFALALAMLVAGGCEPSPPGWIPVLEESPTGYLETEVTRSLQRVATARGQIRSDPGAAEELLGEAERELEALSRIYLPIFKAKARAYNAYRFHLLDRHEDAMAELDAIEETIVTVSRSAEQTVVNELGTIEGLLSEARVEIRSGSSDASASLQRLAEGLELMVLKGDLVF